MASTPYYESWGTLAYRRPVASNPETIKNYFDQLEEVLVSNSLYNCPSRIYNIDESGFPLQHHPGKRIEVCDQKHVVVNTSGDKTQIMSLFWPVSELMDAICHLWWFLSEVI